MARLYRGSARSSFPALKYNSASLEAVVATSEEVAPIACSWINKNFSRSAIVSSFINTADTGDSRAIAFGCKGRKQLSERAPYVLFERNFIAIIWAALVKAPITRRTLKYDRLLALSLAAFKSDIGLSI
jgi:hypothetical protein